MGGSTVRLTSILQDIAAKQLLDDHAYRKKPVFMFVGAQDVNGGSSCGEFQHEKPIRSAGWTAFHFAAHEGHVDCIEELVLAGTSCIDYLDSYVKLCHVS